MAGGRLSRSGPFSDARVLVTGGSGFLGGHIFRRLTAYGIESAAGVRQADVGSDRSMHLDVTDARSVDAALKLVRPTHVINCAAYGVDQRRQDCAEAFAVNVKGAVDLIEAAKRAGVSCVVHVGTCSEYSGSNDPISEDALQRPHNLYALSKAAGTLAALDAGARLGIRVIVVRPFGLWGPGEPGFRIIPQVVAACQEKVPLALTECDVVRDYSFVADAADWILHLMLDSPVQPSTVVNIGSGKPLLLRDFVLAVAERLGGIDLMEFGKRPQRPNEPRSVIADIGRLERLIGPIVQTSIGDGLLMMLDERSR
jgi:nucleoside-diphosphate-sugar epimerase